MGEIILGISVLLVIVLTVITIKDRFTGKDTLNDSDKLSELLVNLNERLHEIEKWVNNTTEKLNSDQREIIQELEGIQKWTENASDIVNDNMDNIEDLQDLGIEYRISSRSVDEVVYRKRRYVISRKY